MLTLSENISACEGVKVSLKWECVGVWTLLLTRLYFLQAALFESVVFCGLLFVVYRSSDQSNCCWFGYFASIIQTSVFQGDVEYVIFIIQIPGPDWLQFLIFHCPLSPFLTGRMFCSPNILRTVRRTMIRFLIQLLVRRTWFGQFDELYFVLNWLVMRCKLRPELAADAQQTAWSKIRLKSSQYTLIIPHRVIQLTTNSFWVPETWLRLPQVNK